MKNLVSRSGLPCLVFALSFLPCLPRAFAQAEVNRVWTNQQGRAIQAKLVEVTAKGVTLLLPNGTRSTVALAALSKPDQVYLEQWGKKAGIPDIPATTPGAATTSAPATAADLGPLAWPSTITINPKALNIEVGEQNAAARKFYYQSGSFRFVANAPLAGTVMREVAGDFELVRALMVQLPWGWQPKPKEGTHYLVYLTETNEDFVALGGSDSSGGGSKDDYIFVKFSNMGLKKAGQRYAFDARQKREGDVVGLTARLMLGETRNLMYPWSAHGLEDFIHYVAYHKGTFRLSGLEGALKERIADEAKNGVRPDLTRLVAKVHMPWKELRNDVKAKVVEDYFDSLLLVYFFGYLDGDGRGTKLHEYYRNISQEALAWRAFKETNGQSPRPREKSADSYPEWSLGYVNQLLAGRTDAQLGAEIAAKFRTINVKFEK